MVTSCVCVCARARQTIVNAPSYLVNVTHIVASPIVASPTTTTGTAKVSSFQAAANSSETAASLSFPLQPQLNSLGHLAVQAAQPSVT